MLHVLSNVLSNVLCICIICINTLLSCHELSGVFPFSDLLDDLEDLLREVASLSLGEIRLENQSMVFGLEIFTTVYCHWFGCSVCLSCLFLASSLIFVCVLPHSGFVSSAKKTFKIFSTPTSHVCNGEAAKRA